MRSEFQKGVTNRKDAFPYLKLSESSQASKYLEFLVMRIRIFADKIFAGSANRMHFASHACEPSHRSPEESDMQDEDKSKQQLIIELKALRQRVAELEKDTEEPKRMEELLEPQRMLQSVLDTIPARVFWKDFDSNYLGCNRPFALDAGLQSPEEIIGRNDFEMGWAEQAGLYISDDRLVMETGIAKLGYEEPQTTPSGDRTWLRTSKVPLFDMKGQIKGVLGTYEDITVHKRAEDALQLSERCLRRAEVVALFGNWEFILGLDKVRASEGARIIYGLEGAEWSIPEVQSIALPEYRGMLDKALIELVEEGKPYNVEFKIRRPTDGKIIDIHSIAEYSPEKRVVFGVIQDITERKRAEDGIRQTNAYLENIFENSPDSIAIVDNYGRFIRWNKMAGALHGYTFEDMKGKSAFDLYADKDELEKMLMSLRREGSIKKWEMRMKRKDGSSFPLEMSIGLLKDSQNQTLGSVCLARDLSGIKETLAALRASNDRLNQEIIERKRTEEELKDSEQLLKRIIQGYPIPTFMIGKDRRVTHWNRALEELTGVGASAVIGTSQHWRAFYGEERPCMADLLVKDEQEAIVCWYGERTGKSEVLDEAYEATEFFPDLGETGKWLHFTAAAVRNSAGAIVGAIETFEDVTDRQKAEGALRESENLYRAIFENTGTATIILEENTIISLANTEFEKLTGYTRDEIENKKSWTKFVVKEDLERMLDQHRLRRVDAKAALKQYEFRLFDRHDRTRNCLLTVDMIAGTKRSIASFLDITELRQAERKAAQLAVIVEYSDDAIIGKNLDGSITSWNRGAENIYGYAASEVIGKPISILLPPGHEDEMLQLLGKIKSGEPIEHYETVRQRKDGRDIYMSLAISPIRNDEGRIVAASTIGHDITQRKQMEIEREKFVLELQEALARVRVLSGLLPICASCKKIRDDQGYWRQIEVYIHDHSDAKFSHGTCPDCAKKLYAEVFDSRPGLFDKIYPQVSDK